MALVEALTDVDLALVEALTETKSDGDLVLVEAVTAEVDLVGLVLVCFFLPPLGCFFSFSFFFFSLLCLYLVNKVIFCDANCYTVIRGFRFPFCFTGSFGLRHKLSIALDNELLGDFNETA